MVSLVPVHRGVRLHERAGNADGLQKTEVRISREQDAERLQALEDERAGFKKMLEESTSREAQLRVKEADAATLLQNEQNKWQDLSDQLSALTQSLDLVPLYRHLKTRKPHSGTALSFPPPFCLDPDGKKPCCLSCPEAITGDALNSLRKLVEPRARFRHVSDGAGSNVDRKKE